MDLAEITEGGTRLLVPAHRTAGKGPATAGPAFYNAAMAPTRDTSVLAALAENARGATFLDGLAATGARGLRVANEARGWRVTLNDHNPIAVRVARENAKRLGLDVDVVEQDLNALCATGGWWMVEVDPYGSPVPFLHRALNAVRSGGILAVSATDTTALHGSRPEACRRRYLAEPPPRRAPGWKAAAARLLVGHVVRAAAQFDLAASPLLVHEHAHSMRAYLRVARGAGRADKALARTGVRVLCTACQTWGETACACGRGRPSGPYELGPLADAEWVARLERAAQGATLAQPKRAARLLHLARGEAALGPFYADLSELARINKGGPASLDDVLEALAAHGIRAARTHFEPNAVAYAGEPGEVARVVRGLAKRG